jgi:hypothetical protein
VVRIPKGRQEQALTALAITLVVMTLVVLIPTAAQRLATPPTPTPRPTPARTAPPAAVLLPDERDRDLDGVMTIVNDHTFGTAFLIDSQGDFLTAGSLISGSQSLRLIDNTAGMHEVRVVGIDATEGIALIRTTTDGTPMLFGNAGSLLLNDPVELLASPKIENLAPSTPAVLIDWSETQLMLRLDDLPGLLGAPVVGPGGKVFGVLTGTGTALPIDLAQSDIARWRWLPGTPLPLAPMPANLVLRGSDTTSSPTSGLTVQSVSPLRASTAQDTLLTIQGTGFIGGWMLRVRFVPVASSTGAFDGLGASVVSASTLTVKVPAGHLIQDYVVQVINGDGTVSGSRIAFTVTP